MARLSATIAVIVCIALFGQTAAHVCMWDPPQRGGYDISGPAQNPCYRKVGPCGGNDAGPVTVLPAGEKYTVHFQQNANHFFTGKPGALVVDWAEGFGPTFTTFTELLSIPDYNAMGELTQTNFTKEVTLPSTECEKCVLRVRYISNNPLEDPQGHGPTFYQCANVQFKAGAKKHEKKEEEVVAASAPAADDDDTYSHKCCAPESFTIQYAMNKEMGPSRGIIYYDNGTNMMREDVTHGDGSAGTPANGKFQIYSNFTSGDGYWYNVNTNECMLGGPFGLDLWNEWCFGSFEESEKYMRTDLCPAPGSGMCNFYSNGDWMFSATEDQCLPASYMGHAGNAGSVVYFGASVGPLPASTWQPPAVCLKAAAEAEGRRAATFERPESVLAMLGRI